MKDRPNPRIKLSELMAAWLWENFHSSNFKVDDLVTKQMQFMTEVIEYLIPERDPKRNPLFDPDGNELSVNWIMRTPDALIDEMETKAKSLGLRGGR